MNIGERLREERTRLGLSQSALSEICGINRGTPSTWEKGDQTPNAAVLAMMARHGFDVQFIVTGHRSFDPSAQVRSEFLETLADRLKQERKRLGMTIGQLAEKAGVDRLALMKWEDGEYRPDSLALQQLHAAGVDVAYVLLSLVSGSESEGSSAADELELLKLYRAAPNEQAKVAARRVVGALVDSFSSTK